MVFVCLEGLLKGGFVQIFLKQILADGSCICFFFRKGVRSPTREKKRKRKKRVMLSDAFFFGGGGGLFDFF